MQQFQETPLAERWNWISAFSRWCIMTACKSSKNVISWTLKLDFSAQLMVYYDSMQKFQETPLAERWNWISAFSRWCIMTGCESFKKRHQLNAETGFQRSADGVWWQHAEVPRNAIDSTLKLDFSVQLLVYYDSMQKFQETPLAERWNWISAFSRWCIMTGCKSSKKRR